MINQIKTFKNSSHRSQNSKIIFKQSLHPELSNYSILEKETYHHVRATLGGVADGGGAPFDNEASRYRGGGRRCRCRRCRRGGARRLAGLGGRCRCDDGRRGHRLILVGAGLVRCPADNAADDGHTCSRGRCRTRCSGQLIRRQRAPNVFSFNNNNKKKKKIDEFNILKIVVAFLIKSKLNKFEWNLLWRRWKDF